MHPVYHREKNGGGSFVTQLSDGTEVPWRPLSIGEFLEYDALIKSQAYPYSFIENEVFCKCVKSPVLVQSIDTLPAGLVSSVVTGILYYSGPHSIDQLEIDPESQRPKAKEVMHMLVTYVCQGFPAYKPEDVYAMDYSTFSLRIVQAEDKLLRTGAVSEPLQFLAPGQEVQKAPQPQPVAKSTKTQDLLNKYYEQQKTKKQPVQAPSTNNTIIKAQDIQEHSMAYVGHEKEDKHLLEHQMIKETSSIYADYLRQSKDGKISIKTPEQRKAEYLANVEKSKKLMAEKTQKKTETQQKPVPQEVKKGKQLPRKRRR